MKKNAKNMIIDVDMEWIAQMSKSVKEDQEVIKELAQRIKRQNTKLSVKEQVKDILDDAAYARGILNSPVEFTMNSMAKEMGMKSATRLQRELEELGIIYREGEVYHLMSEFCGYGLTSYKVFKGKQLMVWTQKGRIWLHNLVKRGILMTEPRPCKPYEKHKKGKYTEERKAAKEIQEAKKQALRPITETKPLPKAMKNKEMLLNLIDQMQGYFDCVISLARQCIEEDDERGRRLLMCDIRSINDSTPLMMRKLENECYNVLAAN